LSREVAPDQAGTASPFRLKSLLPGDRIELVQPVLRLTEVIAAAAERRVALLDKVGLLPGQRQRRAMAVGFRAGGGPR